MIHKSTLKKIIILAGILIPVFLVIFGYFYVLPRVIDIDKYKTQIRDVFNRRITCPAELGKLDIELKWNLRVKINIDNIVIKNEDDSNIINLGPSSIEVSLPALIRNTVILKDIRINTFSADIVRFQNGEFNLTKILAEPKKPKYKLVIKNTNISINGYRLNFTDNFITPSKNYVFIGENAEISDFNPKKFVKISSVGKILFKNKSDVPFDIDFSSALPLKKGKKLSIQGQLLGLEIDELVPYINKVSSNKLVSLAGKGNIKFDIDFYKKMFAKNNFSLESTVKGLKIETLKQGLISKHDEKIKLSTTGYYDRNSIYLDKFKIKGADLNINTYGEIQNYKSANNKILDLKLNIIESKIENIAELFPKLIKTKRNYFKNISKHKVKALISGTVQIKGISKAPNMFGSIDYKDLSMFGGFKDTPGCFGKVEFVGATIMFKNKIFLDKDSFVNVTGRTIPFNKKTLNIDITSNDIDFARTQRVLFALKDFFRIKLGPVVDMNFKGMGRVNLNIAGKYNDVKISGYIEAKGAQIKYKTLSKPAENVQGKIIFAGKKVFYDELNGFVEGSKVFPSGYSTLDDYSDVLIHIPKLDLRKGFDFINTSSLLTEVKVALKDVLEIKGKADTKIYLKGTKKDLDSKGELVPNNAYVLYRGFGGPFENLRGLLKFDNEDIYFQKIKGTVAGNPVTTSGFIKGNSDAQLKIVSDSLDLQSAKEYLIDSYILKDAIKIIKEYDDVSGTSSIEVNLKGDLNKKPFENLILTNMNAGFNHKLVDLPVFLNGGILNITVDSVNANNVSGSTEGVNFIIDGKMSNIEAYLKENVSMIPDFNLKIDKFDFSKIKNLIKTPMVSEKVRQIFSDFEEFHGYAGIDLNIKPKEWNLKFISDSFSAVYTPYDTFILFSSGDAEISNKNLKINSLKGVLSESPFSIEGFANNYRKKAEFDFTVNLDFDSNDIEKIRFYSDIPLSADGIIPLSLSLNGNIDNWNAFGRMTLEKDAYLNYLTDFGLPRNRSRLLTFDAKGNNDKLNINRLRIDLAESTDTVAGTSVEDKDYEGFKNLINVYGSIDKLKSKKPVFSDFIIQTNEENPISTQFFNPTIGGLLNNGCQNFFSEGTFETHLKLNGYIAAPEISGKSSFQNISIPDYKSFAKSVDFNFNKKEIVLNVADLNIGETKMNIDALLNNNLETPILIKDLKINSELLNIDELIKILSSEIKENTQILPIFVVEKGNLNANELIIRDLITTNIKAVFNFTPDWLLSAPEVDFSAANGQASGNAFYNLKTNELSSEFQIESMQANALATTLLTLPNEVYGTLDGNFNFSTRGKSPQELIANSNGYAKFKVENGHFVRLGSLEYFLRAVNVLQSGVGGFNINNIIDLIAPQKTGHFKLLKGSISAKDGVIYTDDITSSGNNLSLFISGKLDMLTNESDIQVLGRLSKKVSGLLGPAGSVSINQFIDYIPGLGFLPATPGRKGIVDLIPGLSKIPGLEISNHQKYRRFAVQIFGDLYDQSSVRSFRWIE